MSNCSIAGNADVSGIGIRLNLYATVILMAAIPDIPGRTSPLVEVLAENAGISGLALLITAINETRCGRLSLYHAIFIIHILYFTGILVAPAGHYKRNTNSRRAILSGLITYGCYLLFTGYALYVWTKGAKWDLGKFTCPDPNTEDINGRIEYILFFRQVPVNENWLRVVWMVSLCLSLATLLFFPIFGCICLLNGSSIPGGLSTHHKNSWFFWIFWAGKILAAIYGVATLQIYEKTNVISGILEQGPENEWSFGQVFALVQLVTTLNEAIHCLISMCSESARSGDDNTGEDRRSVVSAYKLDSVPSHQRPDPARFGFGPRTRENDRYRSAWQMRVEQAALV